APPGRRLASHQAVSSPFAIHQLTEGSSLADWRPSNRPPAPKPPAAATVRTVVAPDDAPPPTAPTPREEVPAMASDNAAKIIAALKEHGPLKPADLAARTRLTISAVKFN